MLQVVAVEGNRVTVAPPISVDLDQEQQPQMRPTGLVVGAGLQGLYLRRLDTSDRETVEIKNAARCWIREVESEDTFRAHVSMQ